MDVVARATDARPGTTRPTMDALVIRGGTPLAGRIEVSGAKNAALPLMAATLLTPGLHRLRNVPQLSDTRTMARVLQVLGARVAFTDHTLEIDTTGVGSVEAPYELVKTMRASIYVLGPLLARFGSARVSLPGGCAWGPRPVNLHLEGLNAMNANLEIDHGYIVGRDVALKGAEFKFEVVSVGATAQLVMAAALARGTTTLHNVAIEPDITALADALVTCGADIQGIGTRTLVIRGVDALRPMDVEVIPDRIEGATFLAAAAITGGNLTVERCEPEHMRAVIDKLQKAGCEIHITGQTVTVRGPKRPAAVNVTTDVYPGFPTDVQAQFMAVATVADGASAIKDTIYLDRFTHVPELVRLGADIKLQGNVALVTGVERLQGAPVMATDIRASAALVLAALVTEGETRISRIYHLDRGHEKLDERLRRVGADIQRIRE